MTIGFLGEPLEWYDKLFKQEEKVTVTDLYITLNTSPMVAVKWRYRTPGVTRSDQLKI